MKEQFPYFKNNKDSIFLDSAASSQIHINVLERINDVYTNHYSNIHRGIYKQSEQTSSLYESSRSNLASFLNCEADDIIWTKGTTESLNLLANHYYTILEPGDSVLLSKMEHHANLVPWQRLKEKGIIIKFINVNDGILDMEHFKSLIDTTTKVLSICHASNVTGVINPIDEIISICKKHKIDTVIDAAQTFSHLSLDVKKIDCDFLVFSAHKAYGPNAVGVLYGKHEKLKDLTLYQVGGDTIENVTYEKTIFHEPPYCFEAGTPNITGIIAFNEAINFLKSNRNNNAYLFSELKKYLIENDFIVIASSQERVPIISFYHPDINNLDLAYYLSIKNICFRVGDHCAMPFIKENLKISSTIRFSLGVYNDIEDIYQSMSVINSFLNRRK